jgi:hypothetical protein
MARAERLAQALAETQYPAQGTQPYGRSGSILVLNPTDRRVVSAAHTEQLAAPPELRSPPVIRAWPEPIAPAPPPSTVPVVSGVDTGPDNKAMVVTGSNFDERSIIWLSDDSKPEWVQIDAVFVSSTQLTSATGTMAGQGYHLTVQNEDTGEESAEFAFTA